MANSQTGSAFPSMIEVTSVAALARQIKFIWEVWDALPDVVKSQIASLQPGPYAVIQYGAKQIAVFATVGMKESPDDLAARLLRGATNVPIGGGPYLFAVTFDSAGSRQSRDDDWTDAQKKRLRRLYSKHSAGEIAQKLGKSERAVRSQVTRLGLKKQEQRLWSPAEERRLASLYAKHSQAEIALIMERSVRSIKSKISVLGLTKADAVKKATKKKRG